MSVFCRFSLSGELCSLNVSSMKIDIRICVEFLKHSTGITMSTKKRAPDALEAMGLSISDAIRLLMPRIAEERRMPFDVKAPNATTRKAIAELEGEKGKRFASVDDLMADLRAIGNSDHAL